jgi:hypothetical protein
MIVSDQIAHQHIENIIVDWDRFPKARHTSRLSSYTGNWTAIFLRTAMVGLDPLRPVVQRFRCYD